MSTASAIHDALRLEGLVPESEDVHLLATSNNYRHKFERAVGSVVDFDPEELDELREEAPELRSEKETLEEEMQELERENRDLESALDKLNAELAKRDQEVASLKVALGMRGSK